MRPHAWTALAVLAVAARAHAQPTDCPKAGDVGALVRCAQGRSQSVVRAQQELEAVQARRLTAGQLLPANPTVELQAGPRWAESGQRDFDRGFELAQTFEVGGQRGARLDAVGVEEAAARQALEAASREVEAEVVAASVEVWRARREVSFASEAVEVADRLVAVSTGRVAQGVGAGLDVELAEAARVQARRELAAAQLVLGEAESRLALAVGEEASLAPDASLPEAAPAEPLERLTADAVARRREVLAPLAEGRVGQARAEVLRRERIPDVTVGVGLRHEEFSQVLGARVTVPLPLFRRNQGELAEQQVRIDQAASEARQAELRVRLEVRTAYAARERAEAAAAAVPPGLEAQLSQDLQALRDAYERGTLPLTTALASLREASGARRTVAQARADVVLASIALARAAGRPVLPPTGEGAHP